MNQQQIKEVFILRGIPGCGKSTLAKTLGGIICSADDSRLDENGNYHFDKSKNKECFAKCFAKFVAAVSVAEPRIVLDNTNVETWEFEKYKKLAEENGYQVTCLIVENRHGGVSTHNVPLNTLRSMDERFSVKLRQREGLDSKFETVRCLPYSALCDLVPLFNNLHEQIDFDFSFGDANKTLIDLKALLDQFADEVDDEDEWGRITALLFDTYGLNNNTYIDMEN